MNFSDIEKKIVAPFYLYFHSSKQKIKDTYLLRWKNGTQVLAKYDTCYESDNGLELDDPDYEDFVCIIMKIEKIVCLNEKDGFNWIKDREIFEFSYHDFPDEIYNSKGELISKRTL